MIYVIFGDHCPQDDADSAHPGGRDDFFGGETVRAGTCLGSADPHGNVAARDRDVTATGLARQGTKALREVAATGQPIAVTLSGQRALVAMSAAQYEAVVALIERVQDDARGQDPMLQALEARFDELVGRMGSEGQRVHDALFAEPDALAATYQPGTTENVR